MKSLLVAFCLLCSLFALIPEAKADPSPQALGCVDTNNKWCLVPATAVGWQLNLKDGSAKNGALLVGLILQHEFGTIPIGLGFYGGLGFSSNNENSYQGCFGLSITNWGMICGGVQRAKFASGDTAWQGMLTFAPQLTHGGTPSYVRSIKPDSLQSK